MDLQRCSICGTKAEFEKYKLHKNGKRYKTCDRCLNVRKAVSDRVKEEIRKGVLVLDKYKECDQCGQNLPIADFKVKLSGEICKSCMKCNDHKNEILKKSRELLSKEKQLKSKIYDTSNNL